MRPHNDHVPEPNLESAKAAREEIVIISQAEHRDSGKPFTVAAKVSRTNWQTISRPIPKAIQHCSKVETNP